MAVSVSPSFMYVCLALSNRPLDFTPGNVLLQTTGLDGLTEEQLIKALGKPYRIPVVKGMSDEPPTAPNAPKYVVYPISFRRVDPKFITDQVSVIDFGSLLKSQILQNISEFQ
jgi:hypothetical protein